MSNLTSNDNINPQSNIDDDNELWDDAKEEQINYYDSDTNDRLKQMQHFSTTNSDNMMYDNQQSCDRQQTIEKSLKQNTSSSSIKSNNSNYIINDSNIDGDESLKLHKAVFDNDALRICSILSENKANGKQNDINKKDKHGNTPLHLACMLGRSKDIVCTLLQHGAAVDTKNLNRWTPFHEACSYGNRDIITIITKQLKDDVYDAINKNKLSEKLEKIRNYRLVLKWEFQSWVPFITRVLPSDVCIITKQDKYLRIDTRLLDFEMLSWKKGDSCLVYSPEFEKKWIIMNNKTKKFQHFETEKIDKDVDQKVDEFMSTDIMDFELKSSDLQLTRSTCGWIWKEDRIEKVGKYNASLYNFSNVFLVTRKRREHLTDEDLKRNKIAYKSAVHLFKFGNKPNNIRELDDGTNDDSNNNNCTDNLEEFEIQRRESLLPPQATNVTWEQYCQAEPGAHPSLGREQKCKVMKTPFKACVAMSEEFPITKNEFLDLLSIVPLKLFKKLKEFIEMRLPDGFPVRLDIPVFPFLTARITFEDFAFLNGPVDEFLFSVPEDYEEDPNLFPFLNGKGNKSSSNNNNNNINSNNNNNINDSKEENMNI